MDASPASENPATTPPGPAQRITDVPTRRSRNLVLTGAISVALISTGSAYLAMVQFGIDVLAMNQGTAYATAGVFELSLVTVALLAREAARDNRPGGTLLTLTWALSSASGVFAAWHEAYIGHPLGAVAFRFIVPLLAALMWHLALIGDRHLASGTSWTAMRNHVRMHALFTLTEDFYMLQAQVAADPTNKKLRNQLERVTKARRTAKKRAQRTVPPMEMRAQVTAWSNSGAALGEGDQQVAANVQEELVRTTGVLINLDGARVQEQAAAAQAERDIAAAAEENERRRAPAAATAVPLGILSTPEGAADVAQDDGQEHQLTTSAQDAAADETSRSQAADHRGTASQISAEHHEPTTDSDALKAAKLANAVQILTKNPAITGDEMATALTERGFPTKARTGRTWRSSARAQIAAAEQYAVEEAARAERVSSERRREDAPRAELHAV